MKRSQGIFIRALPLLAAGFALNACGGANPAQPVVAPGRLDLSQALPAPTPTPFPALGARQARSSNDAAPDAQAAIAPYLRAPRSRVVRTPVVSLAAEPTPHRQTAGVPSAPSAPVATRSVAADDARLLASKPRAVDLDADRYAQRESRKAESYRGGDVIVITAGTLLLVLLIVLIVVLLT